jgi:PIN domain nuclease of toxin-antitoxin system
MKALLDTHAFLWAIVSDERLSRRAEQIYTGPNDLWLSVASVWEMLIKARAGKLPLPEPAGPYIVKELAKNKIRVLPIQLDHVLRIESLPLHNRDPFDRILVSQSLVENLPLVSADPVFDSYTVNLIW